MVQWRRFEDWMVPQADTGNSSSTAVPVPDFWHETGVRQVSFGTDSRYFPYSPCFPSFRADLDKLASRCRSWIAYCLVDDGGSLAVMSTLWRHYGRDTRFLFGGAQCSRS